MNRLVVTTLIRATTPFSSTSSRAFSTISPQSGGNRSQNKRNEKQPQQDQSKSEDAKKNPDNIEKIPKQYVD